MAAGTAEPRSSCPRKSAGREASVLEGQLGWRERFRRAARGRRCLTSRGQLEHRRGRQTSGVGDATASRTESSATSSGVCKVVEARRRRYAFDRNGCAMHRACRASRSSSSRRRFIGSRAADDPLVIRGDVHQIPVSMAMLPFDAAATFGQRRSLTAVVERRWRAAVRPKLQRRRVPRHRRLPRHRRRPLRRQVLAMSIAINPSRVRSMVRILHLLCRSLATDSDARQRPESGSSGCLLDLCTARTVVDHSGRRKGWLPECRGMAAAGGAVQAEGQRMAPRIGAGAGAGWSGHATLWLLSRWGPHTDTFAASTPIAAIADLAAGLGLLAAGAFAWLSWWRPVVGLVAVLAGMAWFGADWLGWAGGPPLVRSLGLVAGPFVVPAARPSRAGHHGPRPGIDPHARVIVALYVVTGRSGDRMDRDVPAVSLRVLLAGVLRRCAVGALPLGRRRTCAARRLTGSGCGHRPRFGHVVRGCAAPRKRAHASSRRGGPGAGCCGRCDRRGLCPGVAPPPGHGPRRAAPDDRRREDGRHSCAADPWHPAPAPSRLGRGARGGDGVDGCSSPGAQRGGPTVWSSGSVTRPDPDRCSRRSAVPWETRPSQISYRVPGTERSIDGDGTPVEVADAGPSRVVTTIERGGEPVALDLP